MEPRCFRASGFFTPSHTVLLSRTRSSKEYVEGSVLKRKVATSAPHSVPIHQELPVMELVPRDDPRERADADLLVVGGSPSQHGSFVQALEERERGRAHGLEVAHQIGERPLIEVPGRNVGVLV